MLVHRYPLSSQVHLDIPKGGAHVVHSSLHSTSIQGLGEPFSRNSISSIFLRARGEHLLLQTDSLIQRHGPARTRKRDEKERMHSEDFTGHIGGNSEVTHFMVLILCLDSGQP